MGRLPMATLVDRTGPGEASAWQTLGAQGSQTDLRSHLSPRCTVRTRPSRSAEAAQTRKETNTTNGLYFRGATAK